MPLGPRGMRSPGPHGDDRVAEEIHLESVSPTSINKTITYLVGTIKY